MLSEKIATGDSVNAERLRAFNIQDSHQDAFRKISDILRPHAAELATLYLDAFFQGAGIRLDEAARAAQIEKTAEYTRHKYTPPIDGDWIARIEKRGELQFRMRAPIYASLSAFSRSHRNSANLIFEGAENAEEGRYLVEQFMRVAALEVEIMVSTIQRLEQERYQAKVAENARTFRETIAQFIGESHDRSASARERSAQVVTATHGLLMLSNDVAAASTQSSDAMKTAAEMAGGLESTIQSIEGELSTALRSFSELTGVAGDARESAANLADNTKSIEQIVKLIQSIADRTKILALNALIEAATAGEAGSGFSVVANEMKSLATQTENATMEIAAQLSEISATSKETVASYGTMEGKFHELEITADRLRDSLSEQSKTVVSIAACIDETAQSADSSSQVLVRIGQETQGVSSGIEEVTGSIHALDDRLMALNDAARDFLDSLVA